MGQSLRVLFVDDVDIDVQLQCQELKREHLEFIHRRAANEREVLRELADFRPDIVLCDYSMPGYCGLDALQLVCRLSPKTPVFIVTGSLTEDEVLECMKAGATDYLLKSNLRRLGHAVRRAVEERRDRNALEGRIDRLAHYDELTGLPNLAHIRELASYYIERARLTGGLMAVVTLNIDRFRYVDEALGRAAADEVLRDISSALLKVSGGTDAVARVSSDEFVVLVPAISTPLQATLRVERLLAAVAAPRSAGEQDLQLTARAGVALCPADGATFESLLHHANAALHAAKTRPNGGLEFHALEDAGRARERLRLEMGLRSAIRDNTLTIDYQPQFEVLTGDLCGVEALARWAGPDSRNVSPSVFVPLAEQTGLIASLGKWVLHESCATAARWHSVSGPDPTICVNVSTHQIDGQFPDMVQETLEITGLPPQRLELELTESVLIENTDAVVGCLTTLKALGIRIAVDDFGTGYSGLSYLSRLPVDRLKLDKSLIRDMTTTARDKAIVRTVIALGRDLGFQVLAEGVETEEQLRILEELGCQQVQGYLLARPTPAPEVREVMACRWGNRGARRMPHAYGECSSQLAL